MDKNYPSLLVQRDTGIHQIPIGLIRPEILFILIIKINGFEILFILIISNKWFFTILYYVPTYINLHKCKCATSVKLNENLHVNNFITKRLNCKFNQV